LVAEDNNNKTVSTSQPLYTLKDFFKFSVPMYASFNPKKRLGSLQLLYPLKNFKELKTNKPHQVLLLEDEDYDSQSLDQEKNIVVSQNLQGYLKGKKLFLGYKKTYALQSLQEIEKILLFTFLLSLLSLLFVIWLLSKKQMRLLEHTQEILELKRTFLSTMSHELRTPLGSILTLTQQLMVSPTINDEEVESLRGIENASEHLLSMINTLLQLSKLESNVMLVQKERVEVKAVIEEMLELVEPLIDEKDLILKKRFEVNKLEILTDLNLFRQVVMNLFSNAIKFTEKGSITVRLHREENNYVLTVIDTGIGIEQEKQASLFSEFYQAHNESHNIKHSTGLGLALSQKVAKLINGKIEIESKGKQQGVKATFRFTSL
jgi:signal transduction histidine kinase